MKNWSLPLVLLLVGVNWGQSQTYSDEQIKQLLIKSSIAAYSGSCPCPYNTARNGSRCGKRSAWSRPGGAEPLCYPSDVTDEMVMEWKKRNGQRDLEEEAEIGQ